MIEIYRALLPWSDDLAEFEFAFLCESESHQRFHFLGDQEFIEYQTLRRTKWSLGSVHDRDRSLSADFRLLEPWLLGLFGRRSDRRNPGTRLCASGMLRLQQRRRSGCDLAFRFFEPR